MSMIATIEQAPRSEIRRWKRRIIVRSGMSMMTMVVEKGRPSSWAADETERIASTITANLGGIGGMKNMTAGNQHIYANAFSRFPSRCVLVEIGQLVFCRRFERRVLTHPLMLNISSRITCNSLPSERHSASTYRCVDHHK